MRSYKVELGGQDRELKYTLDDREYIEDTFKKPDGTPGSLPAMVRDNLWTAGSFKIQTIIVHAGLRHLGKAWTLEKVRGHLMEATQNGGISPILTEANRAMLASGILGKVLEPEELASEDEQGKDESPESAS